MKTVGVLKIIIGIVAGIMFFGSSFGLTHPLEWLPDLMENVGTVGLVVSAWIFLDGIKDIAEAISLDALITAADRSDEERSPVERATTVLAGRCYAAGKSSLRH